MPRKFLLKGRTSQTNQIYHVTTCTEARHPWFVNFRIARIVITEMRRLQEEQRVVSLAWVVMPDHVHWLLQLREDSDLSQVIKKLKGRSSRQIRLQSGQTAPVWQRGYHDHALRCDESVPQIARYIVANPLRAGLVERIGLYPHWDAIWL
ncbi:MULTISPECIES: REP-associated tyrosine transposase [Pseudomonas]|uniref:Transposase n=1 Tax=Serpens gallinarum TaxID=2763075 RepID=A0ABR8TSW1_9PSED|nr:transposase [Serpens gallinarum]MBD7978585.1 transposase [Serpens gallinarum]